MPQRSSACLDSTGVFELTPERLTDFSYSPNDQPSLTEYMSSAECVESYARSENSLERFYHEYVLLLSRYVLPFCTGVMTVFNALIVIEVRSLRYRILSQKTIQRKDRQEQRSTPFGHQFFKIASS